jgi:hypothetical protein
MAAPHVAGAFALMRDAKPSASVAYILEALTCSGKIVDRREAAGIPELDPAKPRIDLLGALNFLKKPPNVARTWGFTTPGDAMDWTAVRGIWTTNGGQFQPSPLFNFWNVAAVADCNSRLEVIARMKRVDPNAPDTFYNTGLFIKSTFDYALETVSGYFFAFNKQINPATQIAGQGVVHRAQNHKLDLGTGNDPIMCSKFMPINVGGFNTLRVVSDGSAHSFFLNGALVCTFSDATYSTGQVAIAAFVNSGGHSLAVDYVRVKAIGRGKGASEEELMDPESFAAQAVAARGSLGGSIASAR